ncbi:MAG TPA: ferric reductase-like transmembrane domain-containing protein [Candidatus Limnocylindria bacterium]|nr:ferric reductase-like transmembrane domain-containing protein [Candidatus Limnocylindria bacterium]
MNDPIRGPGRAVKSRGPLGGTRGEWRQRILRFHLPLAVTSGVALLLFMSLPQFDPQAYPQSDMASAGALPVARAAGTMSPSGEQPSGHGAARPTAGPGGHGAGGSGATGSPSGHAAQTPVPNHATTEPGHIGSQAGPVDAGVAEDRGRNYLTQRLTVATGYIATGLLALTLLIGPANLLLRRRTPISSYLRRDAGVWTAAFSAIHVVLGSLLHSGGQLAGLLGYFVAPEGGVLLNSFGLGNWTGLAATVIVLGLLLISSDLALRLLKAPRWKWLQRLNYVLVALVLAHAFFYGALLRMTSPFTLLLAVAVAAVIIGQVIGIWLWRRRSANGRAAGYEPLVP